MNWLLSSQIQMEKLPQARTTPKKTQIAVSKQQNNTAMRITKEQGIALGIGLAIGMGARATPKNFQVCATHKPKPKGGKKANRPQKEKR